MHLDVWNEAGMLDIGHELVFQQLGSPNGIRDSGCRLASREIGGQAVEIDHGAEPGIRTSVLPHPQVEIPAQMAVLEEAPSESAASFSPCRNPMCVGEDQILSQFRGQDDANKSLFRLSFNDKMKPYQIEGLPPITFFSHSSDRVYA